MCVFQCYDFNFATNNKNVNNLENRMTFYWLIFFIINLYKIIIEK